MQQTGSQILFRALKEENVDTLFGYPGGASWISMTSCSGRISGTSWSGTTGGLHAADGYARASGKVGVAWLHRDPAPPIR